MSMKECSECKKEMSDRAATCPHCGNPQSKMPAPTPALAPVTIKKNSHPFLTVVSGLAIALVALGVVLHAVGSSPRIVVTDVHNDANCTQLFDYCINVNCTFQNQGTSAGAQRVTAELIDKASRNVRAEHSSEVTLMPNATQRVTFSFPEAELDWEVSSSCKVDPTGSS